MVGIKKVVVVVGKEDGKEDGKRRQNEDKEHKKGTKLSTRKVKTR